jgi:pyruvate kinase
MITAEFISFLFFCASAIMLDTKGPEIRTGFFANDVSEVSLTEGETLILTSDYSYKGDSKKIACSYPTMAKSVTPGLQILVADGSLVLTVLSTDISTGEVSCRIENNAAIGERKNMNLPGVIVDLPTFTEKDVDGMFRYASIFPVHVFPKAFSYCSNFFYAPFPIQDIVNFGIKHKVDFISASFIRKASDVTNLRQLLDSNAGPSIKIICKIENQEGLHNYDAILQVTDGIMVARGDLGMEIPPSKIFLAQKMMIREANIAGKYVVTATQMLDSMITNPRPTRAECSDVANAVLDGTDCVMLSGETANGPYFEQAVRMMAKICCEAENARNYNTLFAAVRRSVITKYAALTATESLASSAVLTAIDVQATAMVVLSETGNTARLLSKYCPGCSVICLTTDDVVARQCGGVLKGVHCYKVDSLDNDVELVEQTGQEALAAGIVQDGDLMVVVSGTLSGHGHNNQVRVEQVRSMDQVPTATPGTMTRLQSFVVAET